MRRTLFLILFSLCLLSIAFAASDQVRLVGMTAPQSYDISFGLYPYSSSSRDQDSYVPGAEYGSYNEASASLFNKTFDVRDEDSTVTVYFTVGTPYSFGPYWKDVPLQFEIHARPFSSQGSSGFYDIPDLSDPVVSRLAPDIEIQNWSLNMSYDAQGAFAVFTLDVNIVRNTWCHVRPSCGYCPFFDFDITWRGNPSLPLNTDAYIATVVVSCSAI